MLAGRGKLWCLEHVCGEEDDDDDEEKESADYTTSVATWFSYVQISTFHIEFGLEWPEFIRAFFQLVMQITVNLPLTGAAPACALEISPRDMYLMSACFPLLMLFVYGPAFVCPSTRERAVLVISYLLSLLLIYAVATAVAPWACGEDGKMISNPEIECDTSKSSDYGTMLGASILFALVYVIGFTVAMLVIAKQYPDSYLAERYKEDFWYWEAFNNVQKILAVMLALFARSSPGAQGFVALAFAAALLLGELVRVPYRDAYDGRLSQLTLALMCLQLVIGLLRYGGAVGDGVVNGVMVGCQVVGLMGLAATVVAKRLRGRRDRERDLDLDSAA